MALLQTIMHVRQSEREESLALALELTGSSNSKKKILCQLIKFAEVDQVVPALVDTASTL